ncbi:MAG: ABC transporter permease [Chromatiales bacterium]|jgi:ABC-2 type transport system permease protein|nr:ABC transporter permease [Chromatiales bacterium]
MKRTLENIYRLGVKELWSLWRDPIMLVLIVFAFTFSIYTAATAMPETLQNAPLAIVDEDQSQLSARIVSAFYPPSFGKPTMISNDQVDAGLDAGIYTFVMVIPPRFQQDVLAGRMAQIQLNTDATRMSQAFLGSGYIQQITMGEITEFVNRYRQSSTPAVDLEVRARFNPTLNKSWFGSLSQIINQITMLSIILTGAALIREREHGTVEHLLVMPVTPAEIMLAKVWAMGLVVLLASALSIKLVVQGALHVPIAGSLPLFFTGAALLLFATNSMAIFLATIARSMPQFGMLVVLVIMPLQMLSGGATPRESMPALVQNVMLVAPTTHFVELGQAILFRGAGIDVVWKQLLWLLLIGTVFFVFSLWRFRKTIAQMA